MELSMIKKNITFGRRANKTIAPSSLSPDKLQRKKNYLQRREEQQRDMQLKNVRIIYNDGYGISNAVLRSISREGAKIQTDEALHLPDVFIMKSPDGRINEKCQRVWHDAGFIGVVFIGDK